MTNSAGPSHRTRTGSTSLWAPKSSRLKRRGDCGKLEAHSDRPALTCSPCGGSPDGPPLHCGALDSGRLRPGCGNKGSLRQGAAEARGRRLCGSRGGVGTTCRAAGGRLGAGRNGAQEGRRTRGPLAASAGTGPAQVQGQAASCGAAKGGRACLELENGGRRLREGRPQGRQVGREGPLGAANARPDLGG